MATLYIIYDEQSQTENNSLNEAYYFHSPKLKISSSTQQQQNHLCFSSYKSVQDEKHFLESIKYDLRKYNESFYSCQGAFELIAISDVSITEVNNEEKETIAKQLQIGLGAPYNRLDIYRLILNISHITATLKVNEDLVQCHAQHFDKFSNISESVLRYNFRTQFDNQESENCIAEHSPNRNSLLFYVCYQVRLMIVRFNRFFSGSTSYSTNRTQKTEYL
jgi:hypothetical protein